VLEIEVAEEHKSKMKCIELDSYLKLRYFFIEKRFTKEEMVHFIGEVIIIVTNWL